MDGSFPSGGLEPSQRRERSTSSEATGGSRPEPTLAGKTSGPSVGKGLLPRVSIEEVELSRHGRSSSTRLVSGNVYLVVRVD